MCRDLNVIVVLRRRTRWVVCIAWHLRLVTARSPEHGPHITLQIHTCGVLLIHISVVVVLSARCECRKAILSVCCHDIAYVLFDHHAFE